MKIAYILTENIDVCGASGASAHIRENIKCFKRLGHEVVLVQSEIAQAKPSLKNKILRFFSNYLEGNEFVFAPLKSLLKFIRANMKYFQIQRVNKKLLKQAQKSIDNCDLVYERDSFGNFIFLKYCLKKAKPLVIECNGVFWDPAENIFNSAPFPGLYKKMHIEKFKMASRLICVSSMLKEKIIREGVAPGKITVFANGVDLDAYRHITEFQVKEFRSEIASNDQIIVGFVGHILKWHRVDILLEGIKALDVLHYPVKGLIVGGGIWDQYRRKVKEMGLEDKIIFTGPVEPTRVPLMIAVMDICTLPGCPDYCSPVKLFDYGAAKRPVVAVDLPNIREVITEGETGLLFKADSVSDLTKKLEILIYNPMLRQTLAMNFYREIEKKHTWTEIAKKTLALFEETIQEAQADAGGKRENASRVFRNRDANFLMLAACGKGV